METLLPYITSRMVSRETEDTAAPAIWDPRKAKNYYLSPANPGIS